MSLHHAAQHLASKGRNGDTTLVHMTKGEVAGLQALAKKHGTSLTTNPHTGLPEAFSLKSLVPMAAGAALTPFVGPVGAAAIVGGLGYMQTGSLTQGLMAGMGAYGGAGLAGGLSSMGTEAGTQLAAGEAEAAAAQAVAEEQAKQTAIQTAGQEAITPQAIEKVAADQAARNAVGNQAVWEQSAADYASNAAGNNYELAGGFRPVVPGAENAYAPGTMPARTMDAMVPSNTGFTASTQQTLAQSPMQSGLSAAIDKPGAYVDKLGGGMKAAQYGGAALAPVIADKMAPDKYVPPEVKSDADMGQRYAYDSGYDNSVPERTGQPAYKAVSDEEAKKLYGFAEGGDVQYPYNEPVVRMADGGGASSAAAAPSVGYEAGPFSGADFSGYGGPDVGNYSGYDGVNVGNYSGYDSAPNAGRGISAAAPRVARVASPVTAPANGMRYDPATQTFVGSGPAESTIYKGGGEYGLDEAGQKAADEAVAAAAAAVVPDYANVGYGYGGGAANGGLMQAYANGGSTLGGYSDGGRLLRGPGDGVSDSIPAVIGRKQPARLADGEFVVPARIVSEIGNGSTEAGARKLYAMMDRVQKARGKTVGKGKVAKNTRADKFLPA